jgi:transcriptional regulator with XRE-family HTH domain
MSLTSINFGLDETLHDPVQRQEFFKSIAQDEIASQIRSLRKERGMNQTALAKAADMKQSAVSRIEQAEYSSWSLTTLFRVAAALNARWRLILEPCEIAVKEYTGLEMPAAVPSQSYNALRAFSATAEDRAQPISAYSAALSENSITLRNPMALTAATAGISLS